MTAKGFKSFANKTELIFGNQFNCVLGPNGAGKSNIVDLICFVLGKSSAKSLRAEKSANLIFNGGKKGKAAKEAEASIVFCNKAKKFASKEENIKITRVLRNNGTSIYKINDKTSTRQQVVDLLKSAKVDPDSHNILLQGDVINFMEMKPLERRLIIDQISGISVFEEKKEKCLQELQKVDSKLNEAEIILIEREANLRELKKERDQAIKFKQLQENLKDYKATHINNQLKLRNEKLAEIEKNLKEFESKTNECNTQISELKTKIEEHKNTTKEINNEIEEKGEKEQLILRKQIEELKTTIIKSTSRLDVCSNEIEKIKSRKEQLGKNQKELGIKIKELEEKKLNLNKKLNLLKQEENDTEKDIQEFKKKNNINNFKDINNFLESIENTIETTLKDITRFQEEKQAILRSKDQIEFQLKDIDEKLRNIKGTSKTENFTKLKEFKQKFKDTTIKLTKSLSEDSLLAVQLQSLRQNLLYTNEELAKLMTKQASIRERIAGDIATRKIIEQRNKIKGIFGVVSELGQVPTKYSVALEIAAGQRIQSIVVDNDVTAQKCIEFLKENRLGTATFIPLNKIKAREMSLETKQILSQTEGLAIDLIKFDPRYKNVFSFVLGSTVIIKDINIGRKIGVGRARMVTIEGDLLETSGAMIGGYRQKSRGLGFKEEEVDSEIPKLEKEIEKYQEKLNIIESKRLENENNLFKLREEKAILETEIIQLEKSMGLNSTNLEVLTQEKTKLEEQIKDLNNQQKEMETKIINSNKELNNLKENKHKTREKLSNSELRKNLEELESHKLEVKSDGIEFEAQIRNLELQINSVLQPEIIKSINILKQHDKEFEEFKKEIELLNQILKERQKELREKENLEKKYYGQFKELVAKRNKLEEKIQIKETNIIREEEKIKSVQQKLNNVIIDKAKMVAEIEGLQKEFEPLHEAKIKRGIVYEELFSLIRETEKEINKIGNVNLRALEVYEEIEKELEKLEEKVSKLRTEKEDVLGMITEVENKKQDVFLKTYNKIEKTFKNIFQSLTTKGEAHMELENPEKIFEGGIDFKVKITGNKFLDVKALSGGEKTMCALAFIFSLQEFEPSPFYLLDEVDAALDKKNSELLSKLIKKYADKAQYIVISHNDTIINEADQIYGVSMQDGISKVISLKI